jgi:hypothetical protein
MQMQSGEFRTDSIAVVSILRWIARGPSHMDGRKMAMERISVKGCMGGRDPVAGHGAKLSKSTQAFYLLWLPSYW